MTRGHGDTGDAELKGGSIGEPESMMGHMTEALIPVSGFPLSGFLPATCHPGLPPAT